ncbi:c-type cytochrome [Aquihabitans sp. McL0605]|uniref:cytochrome bc1 complex diheme cytochrome c subunit n=1 Tax=Aquihabitans sp. McL0605 TaxID=3415671 RepID=UPI003CF76AA2
MLGLRHLPPFGALVIAACVAWSGAGASSAAAPTQDRATEGRQIWLADCATCHGPDASGTSRGPDLRQQGTASVDFMVRTGRMPLTRPDEKMQRHPSRYDEAQIQALNHFTASLIDGPEAFTPASDDVDLGAGQAQYVASCAACHQAAGAGGALANGDTAPDLHAADRREIGEAIRTGPGNMPAFSRSTTSDRDVEDISGYVLQLSAHDRGGLGLGHLGPVPEGMVAWVVGLGGVVLVARWLGTTRADDQSS